MWVPHIIVERKATCSGTIWASINGGGQPVGVNVSPECGGKIPVSIGTFKTEQVVNKLTVDCLLGVDYLLLKVMRVKKITSIIV